VIGLLKSCTPSYHFYLGLIDLLGNRGRRTERSLLPRRYALICLSSLASSTAEEQSTRLRSYVACFKSKGPGNAAAIDSVHDTLMDDPRTLYILTKQRIKRANGSEDGNCNWGEERQREGRAEELIAFI